MRVHATIRLLICAGMLVGALPVAAEQLRLNASPWPPYVDKGAQGYGFATVVVSQALKRAGYDTTTTIHSWSSVLESTRAGDHDVISSIWQTPERADWLAFSKPYISNEISFVKRADSTARFKGRDDLVGKTIGVVSDYAYSDQPYDTTGIDIVLAGSVAENIAQLRAGKIDLVLADRRVALYEINERAAARSFDVLPNPLLERGLRIAVPKDREDHAEIIAAFESAIAEMREDGSFNAILARFRVSN